MFINIIVFVLSLVAQIGLMTLIDPDKYTGVLYHIWNVVFAVNSGLVLGSFFSLISIFISFIFKSYYDLTNKLYFKRGVLFGLFISTALLLKFYNFFDKFIVIFLLIITIALDLIVIEETD
jgi:hypothetical protein